MQSLLSFALAVSLTLWAAVAPRPDAAASSIQHFQSSEVSPVHSFHGTIVSVDESARLVTVRDDAGRTLTVAWTQFTRLAGDQVQVGNVVWLDMIEQGGRLVATSITIQAGKPY